MSATPDLETNELSEAVNNDAPASQTSTEKKKEHPFTEIVRFALLAVLIVVPIRMFIAQPFIVSGASMDDTFANGQYLIVDQVSYYFDDPEHGDVVIFRYPRDPSKYFIKRVIGVPGDTVTIEDAEVTITNEEYPNGIILDEPYVKSMAGDNLDQSSDSRVCGVLQKERFDGRAWLRLFPPQELDYLPGAVEMTGSIIE